MVISLLDFISKLIRNHIQITVAPEQFMFNCRGRHEVLQTVIFLSDDLSKPKVLAVGESALPTEPYIRIDLFKSGKTQLRPFEKKELLDAFLRYAFRKVSGKSVLMRPSVSFKSVDSLENTLCGYQIRYFEIQL